jgi:hypothetical protein
MKQFSNFGSVVPNSFSNKTFLQRQAISKYMFVLVLAGIVMVGSSFQKGLSSKHSVPFEGKYTFSFGADGVSGKGVGSHIGTFTLVEQNNDEGFPVITGTATITAANGDQIFANHTGLVQLFGNGMADVNSEFTITGGTGRFIGATGGFESHGPANLALGTGSSVFEGTISF